jgi:hypothetical protein
MKPPCSPDQIDRLCGRRAPHPDPLPASGARGYCGVASATPISSPASSTCCVFRHPQSCRNCLIVTPFAFCRVYHDISIDRVPREENSQEQPANSQVPAVILRSMGRRSRGFPRPGPAGLAAIFGNISGISKQIRTCPFRGCRRLGRGRPIRACRSGRAGFRSCRRPGCRNGRRDRSARPGTRR